MTAYLGDTVMRQYSNSATLLRLLADFDDWCDLTQFSADFLAKVWNIDTAEGFGLDIWGRILGQPRQVLAAQQPGFNFGFSTAPQSWQPWSQAPFFGGSTSPSLITLGDTDFRQLLLVKAAANIAKCDAPSLNAIARALFGARGKSYVQYGAQPMHMSYHFEFVPTNTEHAIINSGILPEPAGMTVTYVTN